MSDLDAWQKGERDYIQQQDAFSVGIKVRSEGLEALHPVIMIPGVISTGLESWGTANTSRPVSALIIVLKADASADLLISVLSKASLGQLEHDARSCS
jgi:hypothetical protein